MFTYARSVQSRKLITIIVHKDREHGAGNASCSLRINWCNNTTQQRAAAREFNFSTSSYHSPDSIIGAVHQAACWSVAAVARSVRLRQSVQQETCREKGAKRESKQSKGIAQEE